MYQYINHRFPITGMNIFMVRFQVCIRWVKTTPEIASEIKLGYNEHFENMKIVLEATHRQNVVRTKFETFDSNNDQKNSSGITLLKNSSLTLRQAYFDFYPVENVTLSAGRQTNVCGQLDIFSPVDFLVPIDVNPTGFSLIKADNRMPQATIKLLYYPVSNIELSGYFFRNNEESDLFKTIDFEDSYRLFNEENITIKKILPSGNKQRLPAARVTWYSESMTAALTYYEGFNNVFPVFRQKYIGQDNFGDYRFQNEYGYYKKRGYGAEVSFPMGDMTLKAEAAVADDYAFITPSELEVPSMIDAINKYNNGYDTDDSNLSSFFCGWYRC